jgi:CubicO group peptidase (beta-lactamase class C family)
MTRKRVFYGILISLIVILSGAAIYLNSLLPIITGYAAKNLCSDVFVSARTPQDVESTDLNFSFIKMTKNNVDFNEKSVKSRFLWRKSKAIYRDGYGVTLLRDIPEKTLRSEIYPYKGKPGYSQDTLAWPLGDVVSGSPDGINKEELSSISRNLVTDNAYGGDAFAFMVLYKGVPVAEAYKPQFNQHTRFLSWSMAKSFTNAMTGLLVKEGKLDVSASAGFKEWQGDERSKISLNDLLQMQSGLKWNEDYGNRSDVNLMLHNVSDMAEYAIDQPAEFPAGTHWYYSSGTANIVSYLIRKQFSNDTAYYEYVHTQLFNRIGAPDIMFEVDPSGTFVGSSYLYATARDYARFGLLYLNDGMFNGERILPEGWVKYTTTPVADSRGQNGVAPDSKGQYGAFFWLNSLKVFPSVPKDMFWAHGHDGQNLFIIPSKEMVVVVLGYSPTSRKLDFEKLLDDILKTIRN